MKCFHQFISNLNLEGFLNILRVCSIFRAVLSGSYNYAWIRSEKVL